MSELDVMTDKPKFTPEEIELIINTVARGATPDEIKLFLYRCRVMGLDPLKPGMVHFIKYGNGPGTIVVGIEGFRSIAARTGKVSGVERGVHRDDQGRILAGWCRIHRSDWQHPAYEEVAFDEYNTGKGSWAKLPTTMIKKVAEAAALRMAFPDDLGGVFTREEMDQSAEHAPPTPPPHEPTALSGAQTPAIAKPIVPAVIPRTTPGAPTTGVPAAAPGPTDKQLARLWSIAKSSGWGTEDVRGYLRTAFGKTETRTLTRAEYDQACSYMQETQISDSFAGVSGAEADVP